MVIDALCAKTAEICVFIGVSGRYGQETGVFIWRCGLKKTEENSGLVALQGIEPWFDG